MSKPFKIVFAGTPSFAASSLQALIDAGHQIVAAYSQPDRPAGRGQHLQASAVKLLAEQHHIPVEQPLSLKDDSIQQQLASYQADVMVVAAYGLLLPKAILSLFPYGCLNVHASWLPRWRGAAPIQRAILAGDSETGISIMQMDEGLDSGDVLCLQGCAISMDDNAQSLHDKLATLGGEAIVESLAQLALNQHIHTPQEASLVTYAKKIDKQEARVDWSADAIAIHRAIRAFNPWPVAYTTIDGKNLRIWQADIIGAHSDAQSGCIIGVNNDSIDVACSDAVLRIKSIQWPNKKRQSMQDALNANAHPFVEGAYFR